MCVTRKAQYRITKKNGNNINRKQYHNLSFIFDNISNMCQSILRYQTEKWVFVVFGNWLTGVGNFDMWQPTDIG